MSSRAPMTEQERRDAVRFCRVNGSRDWAEIAGYRAVIAAYVDRTEDLCDAEEARDAAIARLEAAEALVTAVRAAGPWPRTTWVAGGKYSFGYHACVECGRTSPSAKYITHADDCPGVNIAALLDATGTDRDDE